MAGFVSLAVVPSAGAGEYHVYSCRTPLGESAPVDGWSGSVAPGGAYDDYATDTCAAGGALTAALGEETAHVADVDEATWAFSVPAGERMVGATLWRAGDPDGGEATNATYELWLAGPSDSGIFDDCVYEFGCPSGVGDSAQSLSEANRVVVPTANLGAHLYLDAACGGESKFECPSGRGDANGFAAVVYLYAADIVLEQAEGPSGREVSGPLATEGTVDGTSDVTFNATDPGAGVWEVVFSVDGKLVQSTVPDEDGGRCRDVGQSTDGLPAFLYLQPCPLSEGVDVGFDTAAVSNGEHHLVVSVVDAAGNSVIVLDREINVENPVPAAVGQPGVRAVGSVTRRARARLTLRVAPHRVGANRRVHFSGRLLGGSIPRGGKLLVVEGRRSRREPWLQFDVIRTGAKGRFHASYRFKFFGPGHWQIRVVSEAEADYPFATGWSRVVRVRVL
jgi:hypothetical protein